ncbi:unnamed protein product [Lactuca virosa]|uniref:Uncharacterized protein n=1 Tax=Lactuca virosa TaxID=75947 RepID=A0AAU9M179_9ASTR|nr:unnamed protein product [Lactuca virosa]
MYAFGLSLVSTSSSVFSLINPSVTVSMNDKKFIESALLSDLRVDGRRPFDYRKLSIIFGREDGSSEIQLGQTRVMGFVTGQLVQPYRDKPNEGTLEIYIEFSPMADPSFDSGRPGESAIELGRIVDCGLRESRAVDTESLCVILGKLASEDAKKLVDEERAFARTEIEKARVAVQRVEEALQEQEKMSRATGT